MAGEKNILTDNVPAPVEANRLPTPIAIELKCIAKASQTTE